MDWTAIRHKVERRLARHMGVSPLKVHGAQQLVSFTFDDVPQSACLEGRDVLERHGCRGTYYTCGGLTDTQHAGTRMHSRQDLLTLLERGHEIACHGYRHLDYQTLSADEVCADLSRNREFFREIGCERQVRNFAYPYGCVSPAVKRLVQPRFGSARGVRRGFNTDHADATLLRGEPLYQQLWEPRSLAELIGRNARLGGWLIFFTHNVVDRPDRFGCRPDLLDFAVRQSLAAGAQVVTVEQALRMVGRDAPQAPDATVSAVPR